MKLACCVHVIFSPDLVIYTHTALFFCKDREFLSPSGKIRTAASERMYQGSKVAQQESRREQPGSNKGAKREHKEALREQKYKVALGTGVI